MKNKDCLWQFPGWPQWPPWGVTGWGGVPTFVKSNCSSTSWRNAWLDFNQTWQESSLGAGGFKIIHMVHVAPMGAQGEGSQGPKPCKFQSTVYITSSSDPEVEQSSYVVFLCEELKLFMNGSSQGGPSGARGGGGGGGDNGFGRGPKK